MIKNGTLDKGTPLIWNDCRCVWLMIVALSIVAACQLANQFYQKHEMANMRTLVLTNQYPSWRLKLPAVTFCHSDVAVNHRLTAFLATRKHMYVLIHRVVKTKVLNNRTNYSNENNDHFFKYWLFYFSLIKFQALSFRHRR